jgi:hypothetical protein
VVATPTIILPSPVGTVNSKKGKQTSAEDPQSGATVALFNPRSEDWETHFRCDKVTAMIQGKTSTGRATVQAFAMNAPLQIEARESWIQLGIWP